MSLGKKLALVAVPVVLLAAGVGFVAMRGGSNPSTPTGPQVVDVAPERPLGTTRPATTVTTPTPETPAMAQKMKVSFRSTPSGAAIFKDGRQIGTAPTDLMLSRDEVHTLTFRLADYKEAERQLDFSSAAGDVQTVDVTLEPERRAQPTRPVTNKPPKPTGDTAPMGVFE
jgi:serine/threonine-protein kinase